MGSEVLSPVEGKGTDTVAGGRKLDSTGCKGRSRDCTPVAADKPWVVGLLFPGTNTGRWGCKGCYRDPCSACR